MNSNWYIVQDLQITLISYNEFKILISTMKELIQKFNFEYALTNKVTQDCLEVWTFSKYMKIQ